MNTLRKLLLCLTVAFIPMLAWTPAVLGQSTTTGALSGLITDQEGDTALPGAVITAVHQPTGTRYTSVSGNDGRFRMLNVRVGGPYSVTVAMDGFRSQEKSDTYVKLGEDTFLTIGLQLETITEVVEVIAEASPLINPNKAGASSSVVREMVESLPSVSRSINDLARVNPFFATWERDNEASSSAVAGRSTRYNNIQIDGAVNNDLFGLAYSGTPGGQADTQPISIDAIAELQLLVTPYDVRQGGFSGGGINLITRGGTNKYHGSIYYYDRDDSLIGDREEDGDDVPLGAFTDTQYGLTFGGPMIQDKLFFFGNYEITRTDRPTGYSVDGASGAQVDVTAGAARFRQILMDQYGFDPGGLSEFTRARDNDKLFVRFDFNFAGGHQLIARHNYVDAYNDILRPSQWTYEFPSQLYAMSNKTNSTVFQLNSVFGSNKFNEGRISFQTIRDGRGIPGDFPMIRVDDVDNDAGDGTVDFEAGSERYSQANGLDQDLLEIHDDFTWLKGNHTFTIGTHNEIFDFSNLYIRDLYGYYRFRGGLDALEAGWADEFEHSVSNDPNDPLKSATFKVQQFGIYAGDQWTVKPNLTLTYGLRIDAPFFPDKPAYNPVVDQFGYRTDEFPDGKQMISPRLGFNWDVGSQGKYQLRGGVGVFSGRTPYVWLSNQYSNTGIEFTRLYYRLYGDIDEGNHIPFNPDPYGQPTSIGSAATNEVNVIDPDFEFPQELRVSLGYDHDLGFLGLVGSFEVIWSDTIKDIAYQNLNFVPTGEVRAFDGRPMFERSNPDFSNVVLLMNTSEGKRLNASLKLERPYRNGWSAMAAYTYGEAESINDGNSSQAVSNWRYVPHTGDPNELTLANSNYLVEHRFNGSFSYTWDWGGNGWDSTVGVFYDHRGGRPYSHTYRRDENGDGEHNDLIYVPASEGEVIVDGYYYDGGGNRVYFDWSHLNALIEADPGLAGARGSIVKRNASISPWNHTLDVRYTQTIPIWKIRTQVTAEVENLMNLFDSDSGQTRFVSYSETAPIDLTGYEGDTPIYRLQSWMFNEDGSVDGSARWTVDDIRSRWRAKLGIRFSF